MEQVGAGTYGKVFRARDEITQEIYAVKMFKPLPSQEVALQVYMQNEWKLHCLISSFNHPNIVKIREIIQPPLSPETRFVMDYYDMNLQDAIAARMCPPQPRHYNLRKKHKETPPAGTTSVSASAALSECRPPFSRRELRDFCKQLLSGLGCLHSHGILHRDLKPANILLSAQNQLAICDFGQSIQSCDFCSSPAGTHKDRWEVSGVKDPVTTLSYRPPELLLGSETSTTAGDMWAVACILVEMLTGQILFAPRALSPVCNKQPDVQNIFKPFHFDPPSPKTSEEQLLSQIMGFIGAQSCLSFSLPRSNTSERSKSFLKAGLAGLCSLSRGGTTEEDELLLNFLCDLLQYDPQARPSASEALKHPWLTTIF